MHYEKYLINLSKQEKLNANNVNNQYDNTNIIKDNGKQSSLGNLNQMVPLMNQGNIIQGQMGNFITGNMAAGIGNFPYNMMRSGIPYMQMNPKMMGKMFPNNFQQ